MFFEFSKKLLFNKYKIKTNDEIYTDRLNCVKFLIKIENRNKCLLKTNSLNVIKYLQNYFIFDFDVIKNALKQGDIKIFKFLTKNYFILKDEIPFLKHSFKYQRSTKNDIGHLNIVKYLMKKDCDIEDEFLIQACISEKCKIIKYIFKKYYSIFNMEKDALETACRSYNINAVYFMVGEFRIKVNKNIIDYMSHGERYR